MKHKALALEESNLCVDNVVCSNHMSSILKPWCLPDHLQMNVRSLNVPCFNLNSQLSSVQMIGRTTNLGEISNILSFKQTDRSMLTCSCPSIKQAEMIYRLPIQDQPQLTSWWQRIMATGLMVSQAVAQSMHPCLCISRWLDWIICLNIVSAVQNSSHSHCNGIRGLVPWLQLTPYSITLLKASVSSWCKSLDTAHWSGITTVHDSCHIICK
jgi:hypothetical protein